jgi:hypothetical protein
MYICNVIKNKEIMTPTNITKEIEKLELKVTELGKKLYKTQSTQVEMELYKTKEILFHFEKIQALLNN